jgi:hypothetical protein
MNTDPAIDHTLHWIHSVVVGLNFCPFAKRELDRDRVRLHVCDSSKKKRVLDQCLLECQMLDDNQAIETSLLILSAGFKDFFSYMALLDQVERLLIDEGYDGIYQVASFHPDYCFAGEEADDAANYTNRSPYPLLHFLRESSLESAIASHREIGSIHADNISKARRMGYDTMKENLLSCFK